jgi:hypothetical protein
MLNHFLAVATLVLSLVYLTLVGASSKKDTTERDFLSTERRARLTAELSKIKHPSANLSQLGQGRCFDVKTTGMPHVDQLILQVPQYPRGKDFEVLISAFKGNDQLWINTFNCKVAPGAKSTCIGDEGSGNFKLDWSKEKSDLVIRAISFGTPDAPGPVLAPRDGLTSVEVTGDAFACKLNANANLANFDF